MAASFLFVKVSESSLLKLVHLLRDSMLESLTDDHVSTSASTDKADTSSTDLVLVHDPNQTHPKNPYVNAVNCNTNYYISFISNYNIRKLSRRTYMKK